MIRAAGFAAVDYVGAIVLVAVLMAALVAVGAHEVSRRAPVNPAKPLAALVANPVVRPRPRPQPTMTPRRRRAPRQARPRARRGPLIVDAPAWIGR